MATSREVDEALRVEDRRRGGPSSPRLTQRRASSREARSVRRSAHAEVRGPAACLRRDALFRRLLLVADVVAIVGAFLLTVGFSARSVQLTWAGVAAVPILVVGAKLTGLYDRDETLLRK